MAKFVAYEWDDQSVRAISASAKGADLAIHGLVEEAIQPASEDVDSEASRETAISNALASVGVGRGQAVAFSARRSQAEVRMLVFPDIPESELPDLVRIQAPTIFNAGDDGLLDFTPLGELQDGQRYIAAAAIENDTQVDIISSAAAAGVTIGNMTLHPFGSALFVEKYLPSSTARLIVEILGVEAELTVARDGVAHLVRTIRLVPDSPDLNYISSEVRRTLTSYENQPNGGDVTQIVIVGNEAIHQELSDLLSSLVDEPVELFNPLTHATIDSTARSNMPKNASVFLGLMGCVTQLANNEIPAIDFLHPTQPPKQTAGRDRAVKLGSYAVAALAVIAVALWYPVKSKKDTIAEKYQLAGQAVSLTPQMIKTQDEKNKILASKLGTVDDFSSNTVSWLNEIAYLSDTLPQDPNDVIVNGFSARINQNRSGQNANVKARLTLDTLLRDASLLNTMTTSIRNPLHAISNNGLQETPDTPPYTRKTLQLIDLPLVEPETEISGDTSVDTQPKPESEPSEKTGGDVVEDRQTDRNPTTDEAKETSQQTESAPTNKPTPATEESKDEADGTERLNDSESPESIDNSGV